MEKKNEKYIRSNLSKLKSGQHLLTPGLLNPVTDNNEEIIPF